MYWSNGAVYKGHWHKGRQHGRGELYVPGMEVICGVFHQNTLINRLQSLNHSSKGEFYERKRSEPTTL
jgi:hypothetical protein